MKQWIEYSLKCRKGQAGFALPVAIGMGLIILLVGLTMLLRSQDSQVSAIAQKDTAKSLNAAETGVNEIRALINQHRAISKYPACMNRDTDGNCIDTGSTESWFLPNNIPNILAECGVDRTSEIANVANRVWQDVDSSDSSQGQYRLLDYSETGTLTVQGRVNFGQPSEAVSELEVDFPTAAVPLAGLWVVSSANVGPINTNILGSCSSTINAQSQSGRYVKNLSLAMPGLPTIGSAGPSLPPMEIDSDTSTNTIRLSSGVSQYSTSSIGEPPNDNPTLIEVADANPVEIWVDEEIDLRNLIVRCKDPISGEDPSSPENCQPFQVKIYGRGLSSDPMDKKITLNNGTVLCNVFIHAPDYDVDNTSSGDLPETSNECPTKGGNGAFNTSVFWVNSWTDDSGVRTPVLDQSNRDLTWNQAPISVPYPPQLMPISKWETKEITVN